MRKLKVHRTDKQLRDKGKLASSAENVKKNYIVDGNFGQNCKLNVHRTNSWLQKRALKLQNRAEMGIFSMKKGIFKKSLLQKGFLAQNRAQKGKRAIRGRPGRSMPEIGEGIDCA